MASESDGSEALIIRSGAFTRCYVFQIDFAGRREHLSPTSARLPHATLLFRPIYATSKYVFLCAIGYLRTVINFIHIYIFDGSIHGAVPFVRSATR